MIFRKKSSESDSVNDADTTSIDANDAAESAEEQTPEDGVTPQRLNGPWDRSEVTDVDDRIDLGALMVSGVPGLSMQVQVDEKTQKVTMVTLVLEDAAVQVQAFAAPRSAGIWGDVMPQISSSITASGGLVETANGEFGPELRARVPGPDKALQPARFVGVDGPRWFLRGLFLGSAASAEGHPGLTSVFRDLVVVRGDTAMPSGEPLPLQLPARDEDASAPQATDEA